jgi:hypothetical protein
MQTVGNWRDVRHCEPQPTDWPILRFLKPIWHSRAQIRYFWAKVVIFTFIYLPPQEGKPSWQGLFGRYPVFLSSSMPLSFACPRHERVSPLGD